MVLVNVKISIIGSEGHPNGISLGLILLTLGFDSIRRNIISYKNPALPNRPTPLNPGVSQALGDILLETEGMLCHLIIK